MLAFMLETLAQRDRATARHSAAVARYARELCQAAGGTHQEQQLVHTAGLLHDVGKTSFPDHIFAGDRPLSNDDWEIIRCHPEQGVEIIRQMPGFDDVAEIVLCHHERIDGRGYPNELKGDEIPWLSRTISVADTFDVMTARDSYRKPLSHPDAVAELRRVAGSQLDGRLVSVFVAMVESRRLAFVPKDLDVLSELRASGRPSLVDAAQPVWATVAAA